jgi:hypothetical protein
VRALRFGGATDEVVVAWLAQPGAQIDLTIGTTEDARDHLGAPLAVTGGKLTLKEADGPIYLTFRKPLPGDGGVDAGDADALVPGSDVGADASAGTDADAASDAPATDEGGSCGCTIPGRSAIDARWTIAAFAALLVARRRRRR